MVTASVVHAAQSECVLCVLCGDCGAVFYFVRVGLYFVCFVAQQGLQVSHRGQPWRRQHFVRQYWNGNVLDLSGGLIDLLQQLRYPLVADVDSGRVDRHYVRWNAVAE